MAGETITPSIPSDYNGIDSGKVLNKEGLLELSGQIKGYIEDNIPQAYTLPTASTTALGGVKVDGETITIENGVISATGSSGGATYTAGNGISIDENNVISYQKRANFQPSPTWVSQLDSGGSNNYLTEYSGSTPSCLVAYLAEGQVITPDYGMYIDLSGGLDGYNSTYYIYYNETTHKWQKTSINNKARFYLNRDYRYFLMNGTLCSVPTGSNFPAYNEFASLIPIVSSNVSAHSVFTAIEELATTKLSIPEIPNADGNYKLTSTVSSGTPTYAWVEDSNSSGSGDDYKEVETISIENLQLNSNNSNILTQEQQAWFVNLYQKFSSQQVMPDVWINGNHILFYNTTPAVTSNTVYFKLYGLSRPFTVNNYQLFEGLRYYEFTVTINEGGTTLYNSGLEWYERTQKADSIPLRSVMSIAGHATSNVNDAISTLASAYATKDYVDVKVPNVSTTATDGVYKLTSTVASGTATFSWEEDSGSSGGGATYTAGTGINIDENNVISNNIFHMIASMVSMNSPSSSDDPFFYNGNISFVQSYGDTLNHDGLVQLLKQHKIVYINNNPYSNSSSLKLHQNDFLNDGVTPIPYINYTDGKYIDYGKASSGYMPTSGEYLYWDGAKLHIWEYGGNIIRHMKINSTDTLGRVISKIETRIPPAPTTDGDYILKVSVSSGTPTYSWVSATTGGSY